MRVSGVVVALGLVALAIWSLSPPARDRESSSAPSASTIPGAPRLLPSAPPDLTLPGRVSARPNVARPPNRTCRLVVTEAATGAPIAGLAFRCPAGAAGSEGPLEAISDAEGRVDVSESASDRLEPADPRWQRLRCRSASEMTEDRLWVARRFEVRVHVVADPVAGDVLAPESIAVTLVPIGAPPAAVGPAPAAQHTDDVGSLSWLEGHGFLRDGRWVSVGRDGIATLGTMRVAGLGVRGEGRGWTSATVPVRVPSDPEAPGVDMDLVLQRTPRLVGRVTDEAGSPVAHAEVRAFARREFSTWADVETLLPSLRIPGAAMTAHSTKDGRAFVQYTFAASGDDDGEFDLDVRFAEDVKLVVHAPARVPERTTLGRLSHDARADVRLHGTSSPPVRVTAGGLALGRTQGVLLDVTDEDRQTPVDVATDERGDVPGAWFVEGRSYLVYFGSEQRRGFLRWDGRAGIEFEGLERSFERFFGYAR